MLKASTRSKLSALYSKDKEKPHSKSVYEPVAQHDQENKEKEHHEQIKYEKLKSNLFKARIIGKVKLKH